MKVYIYNNGNRTSGVFGDGEWTGVCDRSNEECIELFPECSDYEFELGETFQPHFGRDILMSYKRSARLSRANLPPSSYYLFLYYFIPI